MRGKDSLVLARLTHLGEESLMRFLLVIKLNLFKPSYPTPKHRSALRAMQSKEQGRGQGQLEPVSCAPVLALVTLVFSNNVVVRQPQDFSMGFRLLQVLSSLCSLSLLLSVLPLSLCLSLPTSYNFVLHLK